MALNIVLVTPLIPQNTGNIARLTAATRSTLHLIQPLGFELSDRYLKRAGLDYWPEANVVVHASWEAFLAETGALPEAIWLFTKKAERPYSDARFGADDYLVFGNETQGLPQELRERYADGLLRIPIDNPKVRSLNLSNAAAVALYEARRQLGK